MRNLSFLRLFLILYPVNYIVITSISSTAFKPYISPTLGVMTSWWRCCHVTGFTWTATTESHRHTWCLRLPRRDDVMMTLLSRDRVYLDGDYREPPTHLMPPPPAVEEINDCTCIVM